MPKGFWIARVDVEDLDAYMKYVAANGPAFAKYGGKFIVRGGQFENPEGTSRARNVVIEFPSYQAALDCYDSDIYREAMEYRLPVAVSDLVIIEGYEG